MKKASPFCPGAPVPLDLLVGREEDIKTLCRMIVQTAGGKSIGLFITGEQGLGKTSFANFASTLVGMDNSIIPKDKKLYVIRCYLGGVESLHDICKVMVKSIASIIQERKLLSRARRYLSKYLDSLRLDLFGLGLEMKFKNDKAIQDLPFDFASLLRKFWRLIKREYPYFKGLMIIFDDIEQACSLESFPSFLKSLIDDISSREQDFPLFLILIGEDYCVEKLMDNYPPIANLFKVMMLHPLSEEESKKLISKALKSVSLCAKNKALEMMVKHSGGFPLLLHEIGDAVYWCDKDGIIDEKDAIEALLLAADSLGRKQFRHLLYRRIRAPAYRQLLFQLAKMPPGTIITTRLLSNLFSRQKRNIISSFIQRMVHLGILQKTAPGSYQFSSQLLRLYLLLAYIKES